jgi:hypothetical protein
VDPDKSSDLVWVRLTHEEINAMDPELWLDLYRGQVAAWRTNHPGQSVDIPVDAVTAVMFWLRYGTDNNRNLS